MKYKYLANLLVPVLCATPLLGLTSCGRTQLVFATYESYFSPDLINKYQSSTNFLYFSNDGDIRQKFRQSYDIATPSSSEAFLYMRDGWLAPIDWVAFGSIAQELYPNDRTSEYLQYANPSLDEPLVNIKCGKDAEYLLAGNPYTDMNFEEEEYETKVLMDEYHVQQAMNEFAWDNNFFPQDYYGSLDPYGNPHTRDNCSIMDFFIPYFSQDYSFGYKGEKISNPSGDDEEWEWRDILDVTGKGENHDSRFNGKNDNKICVTDDLRTSFDIAQIVKWENADPNTRGDMDITPMGESINYFETTYNNYFSPYYGTKEILLNSDGGQLASTFCNPRNSSNGIFSYNGDVLLSSLGNGEREAESHLARQWYDYAQEYINAEGISSDPEYQHAPQHIVSPMDNFLAIDVVVVNKKSMPSKADAINKFLYKTMIDHLDYGSGVQIAPSVDQTGEEDEWYDDPNQIWAWDYDNESYIYDTMTNFDYVFYTSPWAKIEQYVWGYQYDRVGTPDEFEYHSIDCGADYGWEAAELLFEKYIRECTYDNIEEWDYLCEPWVNMLIDAYTIRVGNTYDEWEGDINKCIEDPLSDLSKSNMHWGYTHTKAKL